MSETTETKTEEVAQAVSEGETKTEEKPAETEQTEQQQEGEQQTTQEQPPESAKGAAAPTGEGEQQQEQATQPKEQAAEQQQEEEEEEEEEPDDGVPIVLVTGASGYVATHVISQLLKQGRFRVRGTVRNQKREEKVKPLRELVPDAKYPLRLVQADLTKPESWTKAVKRCSYVFHIASPFPIAKPRDENELIRPAVEGTKNVLKACVEAGTVKRVVLTSSVAAVSAGMNGNPGVPVDYVYTEKDWSVESACPPYEKSKLKAEQAAWDFVKELEEDKRFELVVVNPGYVQGPVFSVASGESSMAVVEQLLSNKMSGGVPKNASIAIVDVRDVAAAHIAAMEKPEAAGNRYLLVAEAWTLYEIAVAIANEFKPQGYKVPTRQVPKIGVWVAKIFNSSAKAIYGTIGKFVKHSNEKMKGELGIEPRPVKETIIDMCYNLIEMGIVKKTPGYLGHPSTRPKQEEQPKAESEGAEAATGETTEPPAQEQAQEGEEQKEGTQEAPQTTEEAPKEETQETPKETPDQEPTTTVEQKQETPAVDEPKTEEQKQEETTTEQTEEPTQEQPTEEPETETAPQETTEQPPESSEEQTKDESGSDQPQESSEPQEGGDQ